MGFTVLIPARMSSTRLPGKPLADIGGQPMIVRVAQRAAQSAARRVVVATDDERIVSACAQAGVHAVLTGEDHPSGSDRLAEACSLLALHGQEIVVNVQGDEPLIEPLLINAVAALLAQTPHPRVRMGTAAYAIDSVRDFTSADVVKVVCNAAGLAQYFSRAPIPFARGQQPDAAWWKDAACTRLHAPLRHIGIYSYRAAFLQQLAALAPAPTELAESLEQLRVLWHGFDIAVHLCATAPGPGVDTPHDLERVRELWAQQQAARP